MSPRVLQYPAMLANAPLFIQDEHIIIFIYKVTLREVATGLPGALSRK